MSEALVYVVPAKVSRSELAAHLGNGQGNLGPNSPYAGQVLPAYWGPPSTAAPSGLSIAGNSYAPSGAVYVDRDGWAMPTFLVPLSVAEQATPGDFRIVWPSPPLST